MKPRLGLMAGEFIVLMNWKKQLEVVVVLRLNLLT
jgi:hypothetical protein